MVLEDLIKLADQLDRLGMEKDADYLTEVIYKMAQEAQSSQVQQGEGVEQGIPAQSVEEGESKTIVVNMSDDEELSEEELDFQNLVMQTIEKEFGEPE
jgi:hypothetical protein